MDIHPVPENSDKPARKWTYRVVDVRTSDAVNVLDKPEPVLTIPEWEAFRRYAMGGGGGV